MRRVVFENYKPKKIIDAIENLGADENDSINAIRLHMYIKKIFRGQQLQENKLRKVFLGIEEIKECFKDSESIDVVYKNMVTVLRGISLTNKDRWIFAIRHSLFSTYGDKEKHKILKEAFSEKLFGNLEFSSLANSYIYKYLKSNENIESFYIKNIYRYFIESSQSIQSIYEELGISSASELYYSTLVQMIKDNVVNIAIERKQPVYSKEVIKVMEEILSERDRDIMFKCILNTYNSRGTSPKEFNFLWLNHMLIKNGRLTQKGWNDYSEQEKNTFRRWLNYRNIKEFFEKYDINDDRKNYWSEWLKSIEEALPVEKFNKALIMKFKNHLIIEFGEVGAVRVYENHILSINKIEALFSGYPKTTAIRKLNSKSEYPEAILKRWNHQGSWQWKFDSNMGRLEYRR